MQEEIKWPEKVINEVLEYIEEKRTLLSNILRIKVNQIGYILRKNYFFHVAIEGHMMEAKEKAEDRKSLKRQFTKQT
jgi:hypothetical protein